MTLKSASLLGRSCLAALAGLAATSPTAAQSVGQAYVDIATHLAIDGKCKILDPQGRLALSLTLEELEPAVTPADRALINPRLDSVRGIVAQKPCGDAVFAGAKDAIGQAGSYYQAVWATRVRALGNLRSGELWATWTPVSGVKSSGAEYYLKGWGAAKPGAQQQLMNAIWPEAKRMMLLNCKAQSSQAAKCPELAQPPAPGEAERAKTWVARVEQFASGLPGARLDGQPVLPSGVAGWGSLYTVISMDMALVPGLPRMECKTNMPVVKVEGTKATLYNARDGFPIGEGEVSRMGAALTIRSSKLDASGKAMGLIGCQG